MRIPKEISQALKKRRIAAEMYKRYDKILQDWLNENEIDISEELGRAYIGRGKESYEHPKLAEKAIRKIIAEKSKI